MAQDDNFLSRWSRLKREEVAKAAVPEAPAAKPAAVAAAGEAAPQALVQPLPPLESLTLDSDYRGFLQPGVDADLRRAALKKLFRDPRFHFDQMDKLDTYIDDYSIEDPISEEMLKTLDHARHLLFDEKKPPVEEAAGAAAADAAPDAAAGESQKKSENGDPRQDA